MGSKAGLLGDGPWSPAPSFPLGICRLGSGVRGAWQPAPGKSREMREALPFQSSPGSCLTSLAMPGWSMAVVGCWLKLRLRHGGDRCVCRGDKPGVCYMWLISREGVQN